MIVDSSALLAILFAEPEAARLSSALALDAVRKMSCVNWLESLIVVQARRGPAAMRTAMAVAAAMNLELLAFDEDQAQAAMGAWQRFGRGQHPARLNLGDCCAYAAAVVSGEPLLFKGDDFGRTDVPRAEW